MKGTKSDHLGQAPSFDLDNVNIIDLGSSFSQRDAVNPALMQAFKFDSVLSSVVQVAIFVLLALS